MVMILFPASVCRHAIFSVWLLCILSTLDVADEMEYDERLALFRQTRLNPFDRGEEEDGPQEGKTPPQHGKVISSLEVEWPHFPHLRPLNVAFTLSVFQLKEKWYEQRNVNVKLYE